jgi:hypothetical protein
MLSKVVWLQVRKANPGVLFYKTSLYEETFKSINLSRNTRKTMPFPEQLPALTNRSKSISTQKNKDHLQLLKWVAKDFHDFYKNLKHSSTSDEFPDSNMD